MTGGVRFSSRIVCIDPGGAALLFLHEWNGHVAPARWLTVGGGIEPGETEAQAALRELREETGQTPDAAELIGHVRHIRQATPPGHRNTALDMTTFVWRSPRFETDAAGREPGEHTSIRAERWWAAADIEASNDPFDAEDVAGTLTLATGATPAPDERVSVRASKWDGTPHWSYEAITLGTDDHGVWLGVDGPTTRFAKPGTEPFLGHAQKVMLVPRRPLAMLEGTWALTNWFVDNTDLLYIDVCTPPELMPRAGGWSLEYCDLDLDIIRKIDGKVWIDDEDEFVQHASQMKYPAWVVREARASADTLFAAVAREDAPGEGRYEFWLTELRARVDTGA